VGKKSRDSSDKALEKVVNVIRKDGNIKEADQDLKKAEAEKKRKAQLQEQLDEQLRKAQGKEGEDEGKPKPKRGRPKKVEVPELSPKLIQFMVSFPFDYAAERFGSHWKLMPEEKVQLADVSNTLINKYIPTVLARFPEEVAFTLCLGFIMAKRLFIGEEKEKEE